MEIDFPSNHEDGWMPLLDLQVQATGDNSLLYKFYSKKVSNPLLIMSNSALSEKTKRNSLVQQAMTRLRNTSRELPWDVRADSLTEFSLRMRWSGYSASYRAGVIRDAVLGFERLLERVDRGERPLHRPRGWQAAARRRKKMLSKAAWYRPADLVTFIPATPGGELVARMKPVLEEEGRRLGLSIKAVESGGTSLKRQLTGRDLSAGDPCGQPGCRLAEDGGCSHARAGVVYRGSCDLCEDANLAAVYWGESGFSGYYRSQLHVKAIEKKDLENAFAKHLFVFHPEHQGDPSKFTIKVHSGHLDELQV